MRVKNFKDLINRISKYENTVKLHPNFLFRGQSDSEWGLKPSFTRIVNNLGLTREEAIQLERECIHKFSISAQTLLPLENTIRILPDDKENRIDFQGWMAIMQHYSAPTRYLDWSCSPWVALYFSCSDLTEKDAVVWVTDFRKVTNFYESAEEGFSRQMVESSSDDALNFTTPLNSNERIEAQQGRFSISINPLSDHKELIEQAKALEKIVIPFALKKTVLNELHKMNITAQTLYPGIDGLGKSIVEYCSLWDKSSYIE